ncbi:unnamed protein product [Miscanthus lutarioriparius]|uniref:DUF1618 domain-containing protein n=1 Tax=Miscanthus lutarioriparius TaxID=422564 RepID=A0A811SC59_9POAL|nr:unnamed protein product [Miscanthus lutarioriparius]
MASDGGLVHGQEFMSYTVIPFRNWLCWIDYNRGILFGDMFGPTPTVTLVRLPPEEEFGSTHAHPPNLSRRWMYRGVSAIDVGNCLKFIKVDRHDGVPYGPLKDGAGFTITCHTLLLKDKVLKDKVWEKDYSVTSNELWSANPLEDLPRDILMFPQVNIDRPHVAHFLIIEKSVYTWKKMWVVTIDMNTKKVESFNPYINGMEARGTEDADLAKEKSFGSSPSPLWVLRVPPSLKESFIDALCNSSSV